MDFKQKVEVTDQNRIPASNQPEQGDTKSSPIRVKDEYNLIGELDGNCSLQTTNLNIMPCLSFNSIKMEPNMIENESVSAVEKIEMVESELSINRIKSENMESMDLIEQLGIKDESTPYTELGIKDNKEITSTDIPSERIKSENCITEMWDRPDLYIVDKIDKIETDDSQGLISEAELEYMNSTELTEQLDIDNKGDSNMLLTELDNEDDEDDVSSTNISDIAVESSINTEFTHKTVSKREISYCGGSRNCQHCNATFKRKTELDNHILRKHPDFIASVTSKIHECTKCTFKTTVISNLNKHLLKHSGIATSYKSMTCIQCSAAFKSKTSLDNHIINKHPSSSTSVTSKIHKCLKCTYKTTIISNLDRHLFKHPETGAYKLISTCTHCNAIFKNKRTLDNHMIKKHPSFIASVTSKIHECPKCTFKTTEISNLNRHLLKHSRTAPVYKLTCIHCSVTFKYKRSLDDHIVKKHPSFIASSVTSKIHECVKCTFKTTLSNLFKKHQSEHPD